MRLTRRQKSYVLICGLCVTALAVDRLFLAPGEAIAESTEQAAAPALIEARAEVHTLLDEKPTRGTVLARKFSQVGEARGLDPSNVRNAFKTPASWIPEEPVSQTTAAEGSVAARFIAAHRLNAVMANNQGGYAIVDGRTLRIGQKLDGFRLVEIEERAAVLEAGGVRIKLTLSEMPESEPP